MTCSSCNQLKPITLEIAGPDGAPYYVCSSCYRDSKPSPSPAPQPPAPTKPHERRSKAKDDVGSFDLHPNKPEPKPVSVKGAHYVPDGEGYW